MPVISLVENSSITRLTEVTSGASVVVNLTTLFSTFSFSPLFQVPETWELRLDGQQHLLSMLLLHDSISITHKILIFYDIIEPISN